MSLFLPDMYKKDIFAINYSLLKKEGIKTLIFDLDNTLSLIDDKKPNKDVAKLILDLRKDFFVIVISNNVRKRVELFCSSLKVSYVCLAMKPLSIGFRRAKRKFHLKKSEVCMIGDQIVTDIAGAKRLGFKTVLVDPLGEKDLKITGFNRKMEALVVKRLRKKYNFTRGEYYG